MHSSMLSFWVDGSSASIREAEVPQPKAGEALVRVLIAGVCNTDLEILKGYMGFSGIVGHEFVGVCEDAPDGFEHLAKQRVVGEINLACRSCGTCGGGGTRARNHCPKRTVLGILDKHGTYAQWLTLPAVNLHVVPKGVSTENAAFAEPLAAAFRILEQGLVRDDDEVAVVGDGKLGILISEVLGRHVKKGTTLFGRHHEKMDLVRAPIDKMLSTDALPDRAATFDVVVDATGSPAGMDVSRQLCKPLGTICLKSTCAAGADFNTAPFVIDELRVIGSRCGPFEPALELLNQGLDLTPLISATFPLEQAEEAVKKAAEKGTIKVQIRVAPDP
ncbi:hypothetical protein CTAYLR_006028 [Chrysophaeum taylorii]|uniref:Alcohol dehydrogenase-like N-terminal domain-containing protein n=1 Tax=Chrysophaeum taylorii TaxID=2483200 RepID=A0AAD7UM61_9STRA|nr:hypothetical protein CTAYLR_006028 [Chrysophaeum taylorii]